MYRKIWLFQYLTLEDKINLIPNIGSAKQLGYNKPMPELPEVETVRLQLKHKILKQRITAIDVLHQKSIDHNRKFKKLLLGKSVSDIDRIGKLMIFSFSGEEDLFMLAHLKMTGQFFYVGNDGEEVGGGHEVTAANDSPSRHTRVIFHFENGSKLHFNDMRLFGYLKLANTKEVATAKARFGPEPIKPDFDSKWFYEKLSKRKTPIKAALLDQTFIAGLGNIYVDEALWRAKVRPMRPANTISKKEAAAIAAASGKVMNESIAVGGTTFQHFKDTGGDTGNFKDYLKVFGQQGKPCPRCKTIIVKTRCAGRGTHYCPKCQK